MQMIKSIVRPDKVDAVKDAVTKVNVSGMTVSDVRPTRENGISH